jgi:hypothetical protein
MEYTDTDGNTATGEAWSPGPLAGTVWVLPFSGAPSSMARVVHVRKRVEVPRSGDAWPGWRGAAGRNDPGRQSLYLSDQHFAPKLSAALWHDALGYAPRDVVRNGDTLPLPLPMAA